MVKTRKLSDDKINAILALRFGTKETPFSSKTLLSYSAISRLTNIPVSTVRYRCLKHVKDANSSKS